MERPKPVARTRTSPPKKPTGAVDHPERVKAGFKREYRTVENGPTLGQKTRGNFPGVR